MKSNIDEQIDKLPVDELISPDDYMIYDTAGEFSISDEKRHHYFSVGRSALRLIMGCLTARREYSVELPPLEAILDYGSGYGRVARYLRAAFPDATVGVYDTDEPSVAFCVENLGCVAANGRPEPESYDLIWLGSVFTHLSAVEVEDLIYLLAAALRPDGVLVFTTHGRNAFARHYVLPQRQMYFEGRFRNDRVSAEYLNTGFGFVRHEGQAEGISYVSPTWVNQRLVASTGLMQVYFQERAWDNHHDVYGFVRRELLDE